jgi:GT2 family glycosyltransferase
MLSSRKHAASSRPPAVSVILPTFNRLQYLRPAIASVFEQTFDAWELLIADDGSGAETRAYLQTLDDPRVKLIWLPHSGRPAVARNVALREAQGEYVAFMDSDDLWLPKKLETQIASLRRRATCRWSQTSFVLMDAWGTPIKEMPAAGGWILGKLVKPETTVALPSVVVSRALIEQLGGFDEDLVACEDYELWWRIAAQSEIDAVDEPLTLIRRHNEHYADGITSQENLRRMLEKVQRSGAASVLGRGLQERRAKAAMDLARLYAVRRSRARLLRTVFSSAPYSWRYRQWWFGALQTTARAFAPASVLSIARKLRGSARAAGRAKPTARQ